MHMRRKKICCYSSFIYIESIIMAQKYSVDKGLNADKKTPT